MRCTNCNHEFKSNSFAYRAKQRCPECGTIVQIRFPSGLGFIPIAIGFLVALYLVTELKASLIVALSVFVLVYWPVEIIMNTLLIYNGKYEINEVEQ